MVPISILMVVGIPDVVTITDSSYGNVKLYITNTPSGTAYASSPSYI